MKPNNIMQDNTLATREDVSQFLNEMLNAVTPFFTESCAQIDLANTTTHYGKDIAGMEALARMLWGIAPLLAAGQTPELLMPIVKGIKNGVNPAHVDYWGQVSDVDQRVVEMAALGLLLALAPQVIHRQFSDTEQQQLYAWLQQSETAVVADNNWHYFPIMVQIGFHHVGWPVNWQVINANFERMEAWCLGQGWYSDGDTRQRDYYIPMGFHFYGLIYATLMGQVDSQRAAVLRERAVQFAQHFICFFAADGSAIAFGRSLTYRFAEAAFWSACAFAKLDVFTPGIIKGLVLRHLRWWLKQPIFDRDGILSIGYACPNLIMAEDYNAPGSPYWALKTLLIMALPDDDAFWSAQEAPLPDLPVEQEIPQADHIIVRQRDDHVWLITAGQTQRNNFVNTEAKYCKFAYSARFGFNLERGRYGLVHAGADSMLLLSEHDNYWRGRRECESVSTHDGMIFCRWRPWRDVTVVTWLAPVGEWQIRLHMIDSARDLATVEGGFSLMHQPLTTDHCTAHQALLTGNQHISTIVCLEQRRHADKVITPPNNNILYAEPSVIPLLRQDICAGQHHFITAVWAGDAKNYPAQAMPAWFFTDEYIEIVSGNVKKRIPLNINGE